MNELSTPAGGAGDLPTVQDYSGASNAKTMTPEFLAEEAPETPITMLLRIVRRRRWLIIAITTLFLAGALLFSLMAEPEYTATTRIEIARDAEKVLNVEGLSEDADVTDREFYQTQYELLESRSLAEAVVRDLRLADNSYFLSQTGDNADDLMQESRETRSRIAAELVQDFSWVVPVRSSSIVDIRFTYPDPELARDAANSIAENFIETNLARRYEATSYAREFLQERLNTTRVKLEEAERKAAAYAKRQGLINISGENEDGSMSVASSLTTVDLAQLSQQLAGARARREIAQARLSQNRGAQAANTALGNETVASLRELRGTRISELSRLKSDFGPEYPQVKALEEQISSLDREITREESRVSRTVNSEIEEDYREAVAAENRLQARVDGLKGEVLDQQQRAIGYNIIQRDVDTTREQYDALLQRFKEIAVAGGVGTNNVSIVDPALSPKAPSSPNIPLNLVIGLVLGLAVSGGAVFFLEQIADSVILPSDFQRKLGTPLLGTTPKLIESKDEDGIDRNSQALTESYFSTLTAIQFSTAEGTPASMLVTSSQEGEGKSTTAFSLARDLASVGAKVLIIDADMRRPSLHATLGRPLGKGLSDILVNRMRLEEAVFETGFSNLSAVLAGSIPPNPAELLSGTGMKRIVAEAVKHFDHVIVDGPPVLGLADAPLLSRAVDGTVFVVEYGRTVAAQARLAIQRLAMVRATIVGAVLTKLDAESAGYGSNYGYRYNYGDK